jgi:hypothetical protein
MPISLSLECNAEHACHYSPTGRAQFGYINALTIGSITLAPDIMVAEPLIDRRQEDKDNSRPISHQLFSKSVVGVLDGVYWPSGLRASALTLKLRASAKNGANLEMFFRQQSPTESTSVKFSFVVYAWDYLSDSYYVRFCSHTDGEGAGPSKGDAREKGRTMDGLMEEGTVEEEPVDMESSGLILFQIELTLNPPQKEQHFRIATSQKDKKLLPWGEKKEGEAKEVVNSEP